MRKTNPHPALVRLIYPIAALVLLLIFNGLMTPGFFHLNVTEGRLYGHLIDIPNQAAPIMLVSIGMTLVIATGGVDLSVGAVIAIAGSVTALLIVNTNSGIFEILFLVLVLCAAAGMWNGMLVAVFNIQPIISTLILMVAGRGIAQLMTRGQIITFHSAAFAFIGNGYFLGLPFTIAIAIAALIVTSSLTRMTAMGLFIESVGNNITASRYAGINVTVIKILVYTISGLWAGMAGVIIATDIMAADANNAGLYYELDAILAVVIGGTALTGGRFSLAGSIVGALIIQTLTTTIRAQNVPVEFALVVKALAALAVFLLQSEEFRKVILRRKM
ncbi:MAG: ABC transporter permease [bacterium]